MLNARIAAFACDSQQSPDSGSLIGPPTCSDTAMTGRMFRWTFTRNGISMDKILQALAAEFALPDTTILVAALVRLAVAAVLGGLIGWEREQKGRAAGLKTHILVSIGSALFILAPTLAGIPGAENTRVMQGIVSGIGLLGAGAILRNREGTQVEGLTTAASIWMTAAIGMAAGMGMEVLALLATAFTWLVIAAIPKVIRSTPAHLGSKRPPDA